MPKRDANLNYLEETPDLGSSNTILIRRKSVGCRGARGVCISKERSFRYPLIILIIQEFRVDEVFGLAEIPGYLGTLYVPVFRSPLILCYHLIK